MLFVSALALGLRLHRLGDANVWFDEGWSVWLARMSLPDAVIRTAYDTHPPLYYALLHGWRLAAGENEFALRFLSVCFGVMLVAVTYRLGMRMMSPGAGMMGALVVAISPFSLVWPQQIRMYALVALLGVLSTWLLLEDWRDWRLPAGYVLAVLAMLHTQVLGALFLVLHGCLWLMYLLAGQREGWWRFPVAQAVVALGMVPWMTVFLPRLPSWSAAQPTTGSQYLLAYWSALIRGTSVNLEQALPLLGLAGALFLGACLLALWSSGGPQARWTLLLPVLLPPLLVYVLSQPRGFFYSPPPEPRYLYPFSPFVYLVWGGGVAEAWRRSRPGGLALMMGSLLCLSAGLPDYYRQRVLQDDYRSLACTLKTYRQPEDLVFLHTDSNWPVFTYHYDGPWIGVPNDVDWAGAGSAEGFLSQFLPGRQVAWLVITPDALRADPGLTLQTELSRWCAEGRCLADEWRFGAYRLVRFSQGQPLPVPSTEPALVQRQDGFEGLWWPGSRVRAQAEWRVYAWWEGDRPYPRLELVGPGGHTLAPEPSPDPGAPEGLIRLEYRFLPDRPGRYRLRTATSELMALTVTDPEPPQQWRGGPYAPVNVTFGEAIQLRGVALSAEEVIAGHDLCVSLEWGILEQVDQSYTVFVHLLGETYNADQDNFLWGQHDGRPVDGSRPTTSWIEGETIVDIHCLTVQEKAPAGTYLLEVGLYDATSGQRLPANGGDGDRAVVGKVEVTPAR